MGRPAITVVALVMCVTGCASYSGAARPLDPSSLRTEPGWIWAPEVVLVRQAGEVDCGAAALAMMLTHAGQPITMDEVKQALPPGERGIRAGALRAFARSRGVQAYLVHGELVDLRRELEAGRPVLVGLMQPYGGGRLLSHYAVVVGLHAASGRIATLDPGHGVRQIPVQGFLGEWDRTLRLTLVVIGEPGRPGSGRASEELAPGASSWCGPESGIGTSDAARVKQ